MYPGLGFGADFCPFALRKVAMFGGALNPYILNQDISKWHFSAHGAV